MKQPDLGKKISELRKSKGLTQEELVEKCNISIRTIQRIETGEVTPRSYTIKTILAALDYDFNEVVDSDERTIKTSSRWFRNLFYMDIDTDRSPGFLTRQLNIAWIFGIIYFILGFFEGPAEYFRFKNGEIVFGNTAYVVMKAVILVSFIFFQRGFVLVGVLFDNYLLKIISMILIGANVLITAYDIASIFYDSFERDIVFVGASMTFGATGVIYGIALRRLEKSMGRVAELAGIFEIAAACFFITVALGFVGSIVLIPAELFEIIILFKAIEIVRAKEGSINLA